jgi:hypothetical protein
MYVPVAHARYAVCHQHAQSVSAMAAASLQHTHVHPSLRALHVWLVASGQVKGALLHGLGKLIAQHVQGAVGRQQQPVEARLRLWQVGPPLCMRERRLVRRHLHKVWYLLQQFRVVNAIANKPRIDE